MAKAELAKLREARAEQSNPKRTTTDAFAAFAKYHDDPVGFAHDVLGVKLWFRQEQICVAVATHARVAVRSGHKIGKSTSAAVLALWFYCTRERARVIMTTPGARQIRTILWKEIRRLWTDHRKLVDAGLTARIPGECHLVPDAGLQGPGGREIIGFSTKEPERMAGISGPAILFIIDEASGVPEDIFEAIEGNRAGGASMVMFSNPTRTSGTFYDAFNDAKGSYHPDALIHVSSEETPNASGDGDAIPGLATKLWIEEKRREWGEDNPLYQVRVRGDFPSQAENAVVPLYLVTSSHERDPVAHPMGTLNVGVDVARYGDDESVAICRRGNHVFKPLIRRQVDTTAVTQWVIDIVTTYRKPGEVALVKVDAIGVGAGVADQLRKHLADRRGEAPFVVVDVVSSQRADDQDTYGNMRAELGFGVRDWLKNGGVLPRDNMLDAELVAATFYFDQRQKIVIESKDDIKKRLKRSPDRADALALSIYEPPRGYDGPAPKVETYTSPIAAW